MSLGTYPDTGLADARDKRSAARRLLAAGVDPGEQRKAAKAAGEERAANSFEVIAREWHAKQSATWVELHASRIMLRLENDIFPWLGNRPVADITAKELLATVNRIVDRGAVESAHRVLQNCGQVLRYAIATGRAERNPAADLRGALPPVKQSHLAAITDRGQPMNALAQPIETPKDAARRLSAGALRDGFKPTALHCYRDADGCPVLWRIRCKHPDGRKWMRAMHWNGAEYVPSEPPAPAEGKPLYRLPELLAADPVALACVVEGEGKADALGKLDLIATTSGGCTSASGADWTPLRGRHCLIWPDNDAAGGKYADEVAAKLRALGCTVEMIDVEPLGLPDKGDAVDWLAMHPDAMVADVLALRRLARCRPCRVSGLGRSPAGDVPAPAGRYRQPSCRARAAGRYGGDPLPPLRPRLDASGHSGCPA